MFQCKNAKLNVKLCLTLLIFTLHKKIIFVSPDAEKQKILFMIGHLKLFSSFHEPHLQYIHVFNRFQKLN